MKSVLAILVVGLGVSVTANANNLKLQNNLVEKAQKLAASGNNKKACDLYKQAIDMGYSGPQDKEHLPENHKSYAIAGQEYFKCYVKATSNIYDNTDELFQNMNYLATAHTLSNGKLASPGIIAMQKNILAKTEYIMSMDPNVLQSNDDTTYRDCRLAEGAYYYEWNDASNVDKTKPEHSYYPKLAIVYSMCMAMNPQIGGGETGAAEAANALSVAAEEFKYPLAMHLLKQIQ